MTAGSDPGTCLAVAVYKGHLSASAIVSCAGTSAWRLPRSSALVDISTQSVRHSHHRPSTRTERATAMTPSGISGPRSEVPASSSRCSSWSRIALARALSSTTTRRPSPAYDQVHVPFSRVTKCSPAVEGAAQARKTAAACGGIVRKNHASRLLRARERRRYAGGPRRLRGGLGHRRAARPLPGE